MREQGERAELRTNVSDQLRGFDDRVHGQSMGCLVGATAPHEAARTGEVVRLEPGRRLAAIRRPRSRTRPPIGSESWPQILHAGLRGSDPCAGCVAVVQPVR